MVHLHIYRHIYIFIETYTCVPPGNHTWICQTQICQHTSKKKMDVTTRMEQYRKNHNSRYCCTKCGLFFFGTKKRVKEHIRRISRDIEPCTVEPSEHEIEVLKADDAMQHLRWVLKALLCPCVLWFGVCIMWMCRNIYGWYTCEFICMYVYMYVRIFVYMCVFLCMYIYVHTNKYVYIYLCMYIYMHM